MNLTAIKIGIWFLAQLYVWALVAALFVLPNLASSSGKNQNDSLTEFNLLLSVNLDSTLNEIEKLLITEGFSCSYLFNNKIHCDSYLTFDVKFASDGAEIFMASREFRRDCLEDFNELTDCILASLGDRVVSNRAIGTRLNRLETQDRIIDITESDVFIRLR